MTFNPPDLSEIIINEQTLNTRLTTFRNELREALDSLGIDYESSDSILDLIRLLDWAESKAIDIDATFDNEKLSELISNRIAMLGPATSYDEDTGEGWVISQLNAAPNYRFIPYTLAMYGGGSSSGNATGVWIFTNEETSYTLNDDWTYEVIMYPQSGRSGSDVYRGLAILLGSNWQDFSTYQGWCAGLSLNGTSYDVFKGTWNLTASPAMTALNARVYTGEAYHIKLRHVASAHTIYMQAFLYDDGDDLEQIASSSIHVGDLTSNYSQEVRFGLLSKFYAYESPSYGPGYGMSNIKVE